MYIHREQVLEYIKWSRPLIKKLMEVLLEGLIKEKEIIDEATESQLMGEFIVNLLHYPKCPNPNLTSGAGRHSDISSITVLLQDDTGGLYVHKDASWIHVKPMKGALVVNIGDILQIISNGKYKSIEHRVIANGNTNRISVPIFANPTSDSLIAPLPQLLLRSGEKPVYKQVLFSDYFNYFFSKPHDGKQTIEYAKI